MTDNILWIRIKDFELDKLGVDFTFSQRLARDNKWTHTFALRVIEEYKKFIYLCCVSNTQITPSDSVDQAWHLHLTYTKSYWNELCKETINRDIHHNPTIGGDLERKKYSNCYDATFESYRKEFLLEPADDVWLDNSTRFKEINFKRINLNNYWLIRKPGNKLQSSILLLFSVILISVLFIRAESNTGANFFFAFVIIAIIVYNHFFGNKNKGGGSDSSGCTSCDSGCSSHGCSGCSGCGGCGD